HAARRDRARERRRGGLYGRCAAPRPFVARLLRAAAAACTGTASRAPGAAARVAGIAARTSAVTARAGVASCASGVIARTAVSAALLLALEQQLRKRRQDSPARDRYRLDVALPGDGHPVQL